ncbi:MAG: hypothetical protein WD407_06050 [Rhodospirillales bacterium]
MNKLLSSLVVATLVGSFAFAQPALSDMALKGVSSMDAGSTFTLIKDDKKAAKCMKSSESCTKKAKGDEKKMKKCAAQLKKCEGKGKK